MLLGKVFTIQYERAKQVFNYFLVLISILNNIIPLKCATDSMEKMI